MLTLVCVCNVGELFPGFGLDFLANHFVEMLTMFEEIHRFLQSIITNKIIGFNAMDITFNSSVLDFESTIV